MTSRADILATALATVGETESPAGSNRTRFGAWYGLNGQPWCAIWVAWVFAQHGHDLRRELTPGWAYTPTGLAAGRKARWNIDPTQAHPGDIVFFNFPGGDAVDHVGIVEGRTHSGLLTVEGNTSAGNQANGGQVQRRTRPWGVIVGVLSPPYLTSDGAIPVPSEPTRKVDDVLRIIINKVPGHPDNSEGWALHGFTREHIDGDDFSRWRYDVGRDGGTVDNVTDAEAWDYYMRTRRAV